MILAAARVLGENSPAIHDASASLLPALTDLRRVAAQIAIAVGLEAQKAGVAPKTTEEELRRAGEGNAVDARLHGVEIIAASGRSEFEFTGWQSRSSNFET